MQSLTHEEKLSINAPVVHIHERVQILVKKNVYTNIKTHIIVRINTDIVDIHERV